MSRIDARCIVAELLRVWPATAEVFVRRRMACVGCSMSVFETVGEAAAVYGIELDGFVDELKRAAGIGDAAGWDR